jgi:myo-inositol 2-dehydrogenase / D-chiro-inositol 1-dehydrogenase
LLSNIIKHKEVILQVGTQQRSIPQFRYAAGLVRNGRIGKLHTVKIGIPGNKSVQEESEMPVPVTLNYDMWLGSTPEVYYSEIRVHPQNSLTTRPGWLRYEQFSTGMVSDPGNNHFDFASWGMDTELTGPVSVEAIANIPDSGLWNAHGDFISRAEYKNGITMLCGSCYRDGIRFEGSEGWIFAAYDSKYPYNKFSHQAPTDSGVLESNNPNILSSVIEDNEINLYAGKEQHGNWLDCIKSRKQPALPVEPGHRACSLDLLIHIAMKLGRKLTWDTDREEFINDLEANSMLSRPQRAPYGTNYIKI